MSFLPGILFALILGLAATHFVEALMRSFREGGKKNFHKPNAYNAKKCSRTVIMFKKR